MSGAAKHACGFLLSLLHPYESKICLSRRVSMGFVPARHPAQRIATALQIATHRELRDLSCHNARRRFFQTHALDNDKTVFSAIQSTGIPHIGNWLGTLKQWVFFQQSQANLIFAVADLHSITVPQDASILRRWRRETLAALLAIGLDPKRCTIFFQSDVPAHTELMWSLSCISSVGYLTRMTTWKVSSAWKTHTRRISIGAAVLIHTEQNGSGWNRF